ncbi:MAG: helix-turn-helix transcriptional regulator [Ruminococcaceae bacterium]|nr:helix-turn-helix transcriptional regulator [Oscillospiraceae bacterium]
MFYDLFCQLCEKKGVSVTRAAVEMGLSRTIGSKWKRTGATPNGETLNRIAEYFGVTTDYLLTGDEPNKNAAIDNVDDDLREYLDELRSRPETRLLFSVTKNATKSQIEAIVKMIEEMQSNT